MDRWTVEKDNWIVPPLLHVPSPSLHPSSTSSAPTGLHLSAHRVRHQRQKKKEASSPLWYTFRIIGKYKPARRDFICIPPPPPTPPVWLSAGRLTVNGIVVGAAEICHSSRRARSLMFRLNCYRIDVDTKVAGSENWHDRGDLVRGCRRTAVSKCDTTSYIRNSVTQNGDCRGEERGRSDTTLTLGFLSITLSVSCYHTNNLTYFMLLYSVPPLPLSFSTI